jgi:formylglycine-generating enzyme required for sulfatase activity
MVSDFHRRGVKVLFPVMMWDQGTRDEGIPDWLEMPRLMAELDADGINGDTLFALPRAFRTASDKSGHPVALEPQLAPQRQLFPQDVWEALAWNNLSWGDWVVPRELDDWKYPLIPLVSEYKWLESRHMVHVSDRWERDKTDDLQHAFFNGIGYESWENIFGIWNEINPRDGEVLRRISAIERAFAKLLVTPAWEPHTSTLRQGVFASKFPGDDETLWTMVNRNEYEVAGRQIEVPYESGMHYYDVWRGEELKPELLGEQAILSDEIAPHGYGAIWVTRREPANGRQVFFNRMRQLARKRLADYPHEWRFLPQELVEIPGTQPKRSAPPGMVLIPGGVFEFQVSGIEIEGGDEIGVDVQFPWENSPRRHHLKSITMQPFFIDRYPVTHQDFKRFLDATHYRPKDDYNFLRDWKGGTYPEGWGNKPVTWVSLEDARAYAAWAGKRLPHEWEWQYAAQGTDGRLYPWGNVWEPQAMPPPVKARSLGVPSDVDHHPQGASPFGVMDLVGNICQWTDEYRDAHTRAAILRGGSTYQPQGSRWYFPQASRLTEHGKYLLMAPSIDRSGTIGFRCVVDAETRAPNR